MHPWQKYRSFFRVLPSETEMTPKHKLLTDTDLTAVSPASELESVSQGINIHGRYRKTPVLY